MDKETLFELGYFTSKLKLEIKDIIKAGVKISSIIDFVESKIFENNYLPAFPCTVCINNIAAHFTYFNEDFEIKKGDIVKIDFGVSKNGNITDTAFTIEVETDKYRDVLEANQKALNEQLEIVDYKITMSQLGEIAQKNAQEVNCNTIHNLSGHQIEENNLHAGLHVPNYNNLDNSQINDDIMLAIEPYFSLGGKLIKNAGCGNILELIDSKPVRDIIAKKILNFIKSNFKHLPFSKRWLLNDYSRKYNLGTGFTEKQVVYGINLLKKNGNIIEHDILISTDGSINTQFEETVLLLDEKKYIITKM